MHVAFRPAELALGLLVVLVAVHEGLFCAAEPSGWDEKPVFAGGRLLAHNARSGHCCAAWAGEGCTFGGCSLLGYNGCGGGQYQTGTSACAGTYADAGAGGFCGWCSECADCLVSV